MPLYAYQCPQGHLSEEQRPHENMNKPMLCLTCGELADFTWKGASTGFVGRKSGAPSRSKGRPTAYFGSGTGPDGEHLMVHGPATRYEDGTVELGQPCLHELDTGDREAETVPQGAVN